MLTILSLVASAWVLVMYWWLVRTGDQHPFNLANAVGCIPLILVEVGARTWAPLVLTATFGLVGVYGVVREEWQRHGPEALDEEAEQAFWGPVLWAEIHGEGQ